MSDFDDYEDDEDVSLDDMAEKEIDGDYKSDSNWDDNQDDMDSGEWGDMYGSSDEELGEDEVDPWDLN